MARQTGLITFKGQMGGVSFYKTAEDGFLARQKGGVDGDRIKNSPEFQRTRENNAEFGRAGAAAKLLRQAFRSVIMNSADSRMSGRLNREMVKVVKADATNPRGERNVIDGEAELLQGFEFNDYGRLSRTFFAAYTTAVDRVRGALSVTLEPFVPANMIAYPDGATHCKLIAAGAAIDFEDLQFELNVAATTEFVIGNEAHPGVTLETIISANSSRPLFLIFGIEFYQEVNEQLYPLKNGAFNALSLVAVSGPN